MSKKRVNPRRRPVSAADVEKAKRSATQQAVEVAWAIMFTALRDKEGWGKVRLRRLWNEVEYLSESIRDGYVSAKDLMQALEDEAGIFLQGGKE